MSPDDYGISGKVVLLTGASAGIGEHLAGALAARGARLAVAARRTALLEQLVEKLSQEGATVLPVALDLASPESIREAATRVEAELGPVEILINNAGIMNDGKALEIGVDAFDQLFDINVRGTFFMTQAIARRMIDLGIQGRIVNTASVAGMVTMPQLTAYGMTKAAIVHMTKSLAVEWARHGLSVNAVCPGYVETDMNAAFFSSEAGQKVVKSLPKRRLADVDDLTGLFLFLISDKAARIVNGATIAADDGYSVS
jgi:NAD(P)-dependent dehydrogenase (short-subunit alcohol dehydrogenase family)